MRATAFLQPHDVEPATGDDKLSEQTALSLQSPSVTTAEMAVVEERERIAADLHDGVVQSLIAVGMLLAGAARSSRDAATTERVHSAIEATERIIREIRDYIFLLRPSLLGRDAVRDALLRLAEEMAADCGLRVTAAVDAEVAARLAPHANDIMQVAHEALSNAARHAGAERCTLSLRAAGDVGVVTVTDDGCGFQPDEVRRGQGLDNIERRAARLGGWSELCSSPRLGTRISVALPLPRTAT